MKLPSPMIFIMSQSTCVNFMFLLLSIDVIFLPKVSPLKCSFFQNLAVKCSSNTHNTFRTVIPRSTLLGIVSVLDVLA